MKKKAEKKQYRKQSNKRAGEIYKDQGDYMKKMMIWLILIIIGLGINKNIAYGSEAAGQNDRGIEVESVTSMYPGMKTGRRNYITCCMKSAGNRRKLNQKALIVRKAV